VIVSNRPLRAYKRIAGRTIRREAAQRVTVPTLSDDGTATAGDLHRPDVLRGETFPGRPSQERSRRAREQLLAAALSRFSEHGYDATTVDEITKEAGVAVGAFYLHFRSKRQAVLVLMDRFLEELDGRTADSEWPGNLTERLRSHMKIDWSYVYRAWREAALRDPDLATLHAEIEAWTARRIASALRTVAAKYAGCQRGDLDAFAWGLSVLFWRAMEAPVAEREACADSIAAMARILEAPHG
jgi:AcrR family transcriptional regulator